MSENQDLTPELKEHELQNLRSLIMDSLYLLARTGLQTRISFRPGSHLPSDLTYWARAKHRCPKTSLAEKRATDRPMQELLLSFHAGD